MTLPIPTTDLADYPDRLPRFLKYDCGCVGFPLFQREETEMDKYINAAEHAWVLMVYLCDPLDDSPFQVLLRPMRKDKLALAEPLSDERNTAIWLELQLLVGHGNAYREAGRVLQNILKAGSDS